MNRSKGLVGDEQGAIMIIGLFMALSLVGALWMLMGIGEAIVLRERGQEAADAAALSSAAVHARAMNAMAAMNFVMLVMTGAYLAFCVVADLLLTVATTVLFDPRTVSEGLAIGAKAQKAYQTMIRFEQRMGETFASLDRAQSALAVGAPTLGTFVGHDAARHYKFDGMTLGWSNFPSGSLDRRPPLEKGPGASKPFPPGKKMQSPPCFRSNFVCEMANALFPVLTSPPAWTPQSNMGGSLGLPVAEEPAKTLCVRAGGVMFHNLRGLLQWVGFQGGSSSALRSIGGEGEDLPLAVHCNDTVNRQIIGPVVAKVPRPRNVWEERGPKRMTTENGGPTMQVLAWAVSPERVNDASVKFVKMGAFRVTRSDLKTKESAALIYDSQAEFFFDCNETWDAAACNGGDVGKSGVGYEHSLYWMKWRARLTRTKGPERIFREQLPVILRAGRQVAANAGIPPTVWPRVAEYLATPPEDGARSLH